MTLRQLEIESPYIPAQRACKIASKELGISVEEATAYFIYAVSSGSLNTVNDGEDTWISWFDVNDWIARKRRQP